MIIKKIYKIKDPKTPKDHLYNWLLEKHKGKIAVIKNLGIAFVYLEQCIDKNGR